MGGKYHEAFIAAEKHRYARFNELCDRSHGDVYWKPEPRGPWFLTTSRTPRDMEKRPMATYFRACGCTQYQYRLNRRPGSGTEIP